MGGGRRHDPSRKRGPRITYRAPLLRGRSMLLDRRQFLLATTAAFASAVPRVRANDDSATMRLNGWLETRFDAWVAASPMKQSYLGLKTSLDKWDDIGEDHQAEDTHRAERDLAD